MEVEEIYFEHYSDLEHFEDIGEYLKYNIEADSVSPFRAYQEPPNKSKYCIKDIDLLSGDKVVIRGNYLSIKEYGLHMGNWHIIDVVEVRENSFTTKCGGAIHSKYYKYFHLADGVKLCPINEKLYKYRKRFESLA